MFAFMMLEKNLDWYRKILEQALDKQKELNLNPKNCIGTVLSLNGFRKYFCVFHAKHTEARNSVRLKQLTLILIDLLIIRFVILHFNSIAIRRWRPAKAVNQTIRTLNRAICCSTQVESVRCSTKMCCLTIFC